MPDTMSSVKIDAAEIKSFFRIKEIALQPIVRRHIKWHRLWARLRETLLTSLVDI